MGVTYPRRWQGSSLRGHILKSLQYTSINWQIDKQQNIDKAHCLKILKYLKLITSLVFYAYVIFFKFIVQLPVIITIKKRTSLYSICWHN